MSVATDPDFAVIIKKPREQGEGIPLAHWALVYCANLIVPLYFGCMMTTIAGKLGMFTGILALFALGYRGGLERFFVDCDS